MLIILNLDQQQFSELTQPVWLFTEISSHSPRVNQLSVFQYGRIPVGFSYKLKHLCQQPPCSISLSAGFLQLTLLLEFPHSQESEMTSWQPVHLPQIHFSSFLVYNSCASVVHTCSTQVADCILLIINGECVCEWVISQPPAGLGAVTSQGRWALEVLFGFRGGARGGGVSRELSCCWKTGTFQYGSQTWFCWRFTAWQERKRGSERQTSQSEATRGLHSQTLISSFIQVEDHHGHCQLWQTIHQWQRNRGWCVLHMLYSRHVYMDNNILILTLFRQ